MLNKTIVFISSVVPSAATEELWSRTAIDLAGRGFSVFASVAGWPSNHWRAQMLKAGGVHLQSRPTHYSLWRRGWHYMFARGKSKEALEVERLLRKASPKLVVLSDWFAYPPLEFLELCVTNKLPFVTVANGNYEETWPFDINAARYRDAFAAALRCYFVSKANLCLTEKQIGCDLSNAEVVWSQYNVDFNASPAWPTSNVEGELRFACVGRLDPHTKGQDILLEALASSVWTSRPWHLTLYGEGPRRNSLERLIARLGLSNRVTFAGHVKVETIWSLNHVLIMPSRYEGLPLAIVEAMLCGRPVVATDVGGISEIVIDGLTGLLASAPTTAIVAQALERLWVNRENLEYMGRAGAKRIRELVPPDPIRVFSEKLKNLI